MLCDRSGWSTRTGRAGGKKEVTRARLEGPDAENTCPRKPLEMEGVEEGMEGGMMQFGDLCSGTGAQCR